MNYGDYQNIGDLQEQYPDQSSIWTVQNPSKDAQNGVQDVQNTRLKPFLRYKRKRLLNGHERTINEKAARSAENRRYGGLILAGFVVGLSGCFIETLLHIKPLIQVCSYLTILCYFFALDPIRALYRSIAPQSRGILSLITAMAVIGIISKYQEYIIIATLLSLTGLIAIWKCNASWLSADTWLMSEYVQRAIRASSIDTARIDEVWQAYGRRECSTLLYEMGYNLDGLDTIYRATWLTGWMRGYEKTAKYQQRMEAADQLKEDYKYLKADYAALQKKDNEEEKRVKELESQISEINCQYENIQRLYNQVRKENEQLQTANEELLEAMLSADSNQDQSEPPAGQTDPDPAATPIPPGKIVQLQKRTVEIKEKTREEKVLEALEAGMSLAEAGKLAGCSKSTAYNIKKAHDQK